MATTEPCKTYSSRVMGYGIDYGMSDLDGISAAQQILSIRPRPIVLLTDHTEAEVVEGFDRGRFAELSILQDCRDWKHLAT